MNGLLSHNSENDCIKIFCFHLLVVKKNSFSFQDERAFRIQRALHYSMLKTILPKEDWVNYEEDQVPNSLQKIIQQIIVCNSNASLLFFYEMAAHTRF